MNCLRNGTVHTAVTLLAMILLATAASIPADSSEERLAERPGNGPDATAATQPAEATEADKRRSSALQARLNALTDRLQQLFSSVDLYAEERLALPDEVERSANHGCLRLVGLQAPASAPAIS